MRYSIQAPILAKTIIAENTLEVVFGIPENNFEFKAGQYVSIALPGLEQEHLVNKFHDFSIASSPNEKKSIAIIFRSSKSIFKTKLTELPLGELVIIEGPRGFLSLPESTETPIVFIAGGVGIAPLLSMLRLVIENHLLYRIKLLYFNIDPENIAYRVLLDDFSQQNSFISVRYIFENMKEKDIVVEDENFKNSLYYVVGSPDMVSLTSQHLLNIGILSTNIRTEEFTGYQK